MLESLESVLNDYFSAVDRASPLVSLSCRDISMRQPWYLWSLTLSADCLCSGLSDLVITVVCMCITVTDLSSHSCLELYWRVCLSVCLSHLYQMRLSFAIIKCTHSLITIVSRCRSRATWPSDPPWPFCTTSVSFKSFRSQVSVLLTYAQTYIHTDKGIVISCS